MDCLNVSYPQPEVKQELSFPVTTEKLIDLDDFIWSRLGVLLSSLLMFMSSNITQQCLCWKEVASHIKPSVIFSLKEVAHTKGAINQRQKVRMHEIETFQSLLMLRLLLCLLGCKSWLSSSSSLLWVHPPPVSWELICSLSSPGGASRAVDVHGARLDLKLKPGLWLPSHWARVSCTSHVTSTSSALTSQADKAAKNGTRRPYLGTVCDFLCYIHTAFNI